MEASCVLVMAIMRTQTGQCAIRTGAMPATFGTLGPYADYYQAICLCPHTLINTDQLFSFA